MRLQTAGLALLGLAVVALAAHIEQIKCRQKADSQGVLPRDRTDFILKCLDE